MTTVHLLAPVEQLRSALGDERRRALDDMVAVLAAGATTLARVFPAAARRTGRGDLSVDGPRLEDAVRVVLVATAAARLGPGTLLAELEDLYRHGDADEKRAVLLALGGIDDPLVDGSALLLDALRTNDVRLVAAAMGPHARRLSAHDWRHGVLKCLFVGVPVAGVADLAARADDELAAMVRRYIDEREAAGREVPPDASLVRELTTPTTDPEG